MNNILFIILIYVKDIGEGSLHNKSKSLYNYMDDVFHSHTTKKNPSHSIFTKNRTKNPLCKITKNHQIIIINARYPPRY